MVKTFIIFLILIVPLGAKAACLGNPGKYEVQDCGTVRHITGPHEAIYSKRAYIGRSTTADKDHPGCYSPIIVNDISLNKPANCHHLCIDGIERDTPYDWTVTMHDSNGHFMGTCNTKNVPCYYKYASVDHMGGNCADVRNWEDDDTRIADLEIKVHEKP